MDIGVPASIQDRGYSKGLWITTAPFRFMWRRKWYVMPEGFVLDYRSSPGWSWSVLPPRRGLGDETWAIHDFLRRFYKWFGLTVRETDIAMWDFMEYFDLKKKRTQYLAVRMLAPFTENGGEGVPCRFVRRAMDAHADCWQVYCKLVKNQNSK